MWSKNAYARRPIASLTKMMNALVSASLAKPNRRVRISNLAASMGGSTVGGLPAGGTMRVGSLLRGMLIVSGNDAANALADALGPGRRRFVARMNAHAHTMRLRCTHFTSPEGLGEGNRSCAHDLALIAKAVLANPTLRSTVNKKWDTIERGRNGRKLLRNRIPLMQRNYRGITGIKTGHTIPAGWCLVASAKRGNLRLISVVLAEDERAWESQRLLDAGFRALQR
jgi:D-alanyl-D-alanine carboxypeptidase (penicillin-binding protein 5/6)